MGKRIGQHMRINEALDNIQFEESVPILEFRGFIFHIDISGRPRGQFYYTKFEMDLKTPIHSVHMPFSSALTIGETIDRGEGLQLKIAPMITTLPLETYAIVNTPAKPFITFF